MKTNEFLTLCKSLLILVLLMATGCAQQTAPEGAQVWIDVPVHGLTFPIAEPINIEGHASDPEGVTRVEIWVNSELIQTVKELPQLGNLVRFDHTWTPTEGGTYHILAVAVGASGESSTPDSVTVQVEEQQSSEEVTATATEEAVSDITEEAPLETTVQYWADPAEIDAGACSTLRWKVENAQEVVLGNTPVDAEGSYEVCLCESTSYRLTVTDLEGVMTEYPVLIEVEGVCATDTPEIDETPPPAPVLLKPLDGTDIGTVPDTMLRWEAVSDESGIAEYQVQIQSHTGDYNWSTAPGSPFTGISGTELLFSVEYGHTYRWRVRAIDGAGNPGSWSGWFTFIVPLT